MNNNEEIARAKTTSRRKFLWLFSILSVFTAAASSGRLRFPGKKLSGPGKPDDKKRTVKMLTQDGRLVEVDESLLTANRKKVTNTELQQWIKK
ncbi:hypothetical protein DIU31_027735 [Mucilaginibacter rubeus]|uniref:Uncharacterized protein n=1 Tax=Mucilaginibacter rubeus TaxID=2027860 RepID=A0AAE6MKR6_9SPHI|nr:MULTISPECIES: hypothetical protein [Mucilaginibacter]PMP64479.1 MAG: hypothetical protein C0191_06225 [Mucilaginibacter sp.]HEK19013.1 hypothetical protein [Bacteroidota bacterium]NHA05569.1 hypothetical protein [Mucilaginibacter inviolabilis]QEM07113.1 hypothetical protein DIU31_027735 [Mucilaginibacter rubeus]QTE35377.1 hypothetical protein J3L18_19770 [Mucilaginibacter gossypii]